MKVVVSCDLKVHHWLILTVLNLVSRFRPQEIWKRDWTVLQVTPCPLLPHLAKQLRNQQTAGAWLSSWDKQKSWNCRELRLPSQCLQEPIAWCLSITHSSFRLLWAARICEEKFESRCEFGISYSDLQRKQEWDLVTKDMHMTLPWLVTK